MRSCRPSAPADWSLQAHAPGFVQQEHRRRHGRARFTCWTRTGLSKIKTSTQRAAVRNASKALLQRCGSDPKGQKQQADEDSGEYKSETTVNSG